MHLVGQGFMLQQDDDPKEKSKLCKNLKNKTETVRGEHTHWSAKSPS